MSKLIIGKTETTIGVDFADHEVIDDEGWICNRDGELLMWIPSIHREFLHHSHTIWISGNHGTILNLFNFVHGHSCTSITNVCILYIITDAESGNDSDWLGKQI